MSKTVLFQTIRFSIGMQFSSIWLLDRTLSGAISPGQSEPESNGNEGVLRILHSSSINGTLPSDSLMSYSGHLFGKGLTPLQRSRQCILQSQLTGQLNRVASVK